MTRIVHQKDTKVHLAVFDFDGTCISTDSPVMLVHRLAFGGHLKKTTISHIVNWSIRYKYRLPQDEASVRGFVFEAFEDVPIEDVWEYMYRFYEEKLVSTIRPKAQEQMRLHNEAGDTIVVVSASWEPIIVRAMDDFPFTHYITTVMEEKDGCYTSKVIGKPIEGASKVDALKEYADKTFGCDNWVIEYAYGDHHSDRFILNEAKHPFAVTPDNPLRRYAKKVGIPILDWR